MLPLTALPYTHLFLADLNHPPLSLYQIFHREFRLINKPKKKSEATFYAIQRVWIILDSMKVEEMPDVQVQPVRAALVLLHPACPCWEFISRRIHPHSLTWIRNLSKVKAFEVLKKVRIPKLGKCNQNWSKDQAVEKEIMFAE